MKIYGAEAKHVMLVARIEDIDKQALGCTLTLNDSTAKMQCKFYPDAEDTTAAQTLDSLNKLQY